MLPPLIFVRKTLYSRPAVRIRNSAAAQTGWLDWDTAPTIPAFAPRLARRWRICKALIFRVPIQEAPALRTFWPSILRARIPSLERQFLLPPRPRWGLV